MPDIDKYNKINVDDDDELQKRRTTGARHEVDNLSYIDSLFFDSLPSCSHHKKPLATENHGDNIQPVGLDVGDDAGVIDRAYFQNPEESSDAATMNNECNETVADSITGIREQLSINQFTGKTLDFKGSRKKSSKLRRDSLGFRIPDDDAIKFHLLTEDEAASILWRCVISVQGNLIVLNKPPGLSSQGGGGTKFSVDSLLPRLAFRLRTANHDDLESLQIVHRLDKEATGALVISRNHDSHQRLTEAFANRWIKKSYLCITSGIPQIPEGVIDLTIMEKLLKGNYRMVAKRPDERDRGEDNEKLNRVAATNALTHYTMLDRRNGAALLECTAFTGVKHQIRVHLSTGLDTPILGDHKYSHYAFMAPQRLSKRTLDALEIRQSKVRYLGLHLHAHSIQFGDGEKSENRRSQPPPGFFDFVERKTFKEGRTIKAPIPSFFLANAQRLGLKIPNLLRWSRGKIF